MNAFWQRAENQHLLVSLFCVLKRELSEEKSRKEGELTRFAGARVKGQEAYAKFKKDSGLTEDICNRILEEVTKDLMTADSQQTLHPERNAVDGEACLVTLFKDCGEHRWVKGTGQQPVDLIVVKQELDSVLLADCKFGLKSEEAWMVRDAAQFAREFANKFAAVSQQIQTCDSVASLDRMLLVTTSDLAPLLINRIDDYKQDSRYASIPYDRIDVCSVADIYELVNRLLQQDEPAVHSTTTT